MALVLSIQELLKLNNLRVKTITFKFVNEKKYWLYQHNEMKKNDWYWLNNMVYYIKSYYRYIKILYGNGVYYYQRHTNNINQDFQTWNDILPSLSLSTMLNIILTNTASAFIPNADANSAFDNEVLMTTWTIIILRFNYN